MSNPSAINLVVASRDVEIQRRSKGIFDKDEFVLHDAADVLDLQPLSLVAERLASLDPHVIVLGPDLAIDESLVLIEYLDATMPNTSVILVAEPDADLFRSALQAGVTDVLSPQTDDAAWAFGVERAVAATSRLRELSSQQGGDASMQRPAQVITVLSPKGGSGKTTVSSNLAITMAKQHPGDVVLVDLDLQFGDVSHALRILPEFTLADATEATADSTALKAFLTHRDPLYAMCAPDRPEQADDITPSIVGSILDQLGRSFPIVIVDTPAGLEESTIEAIDRSTDLVFVSSTDVPSVRAVQKEIEILDRMGITGPTRHLVMNRSDAKVGLDPKDISLTTGLPISASVPSSRQIPIAMNRGVPLVELDPRCAAARNLSEFANKLTGHEPERSGLLKGLRR